MSGHFYGCVALFGLLFATATVALGQPPESEENPAADESPIPTLPETQVEAEAPQPTATPNTLPPFPPAPTNPAPFQIPSILQGTMFDSPAADGYRAPSSKVGSKFDVPEIDLPASVDVITPELLYDQQILNVDDVLRDIAGAVKTGDNLRADAFFLRGFEVRSRDYRKNGFVDPTYTPRDFANVERVEILKGPASVLYGSSAPSGTVNLITKKPLAERFDRVDYQLSQYAGHRMTIDSTGPVNDDRDVLYRINAAYENADSFRDSGFLERTFVSPVMIWVVDDDTQITWEGEYHRDRRRFDTGVAAIGGDPEVLPPERYLGEPGYDQQSFQDIRQTLTMTRRLNDIWTLSLGTSSLWYDAPSQGTIPDGFIDPMTVSRMRQNIQEFDEQYHSVVADVAGEFLLGEIEHKFVFGTEHGWFISDKFISNNSLSAIEPLPIDVYNPVYSNPPVFLPIARFESVLRQNRHGFYFQDLAEISPNWSVMSGVRYDVVDQTYFRKSDLLIIPLIPPTRSEQTFHRVTPRVGLVYQPVPDELTFYTTYSRSFNPPGGGARLGTDALKPETGSSVEAGMKAMLTERLALNVAGFHIIRENVTVDRIIDTPPFFATDQIGSQTSNGMELELIGNLTDRWTLTGNYAVTATELSDDVDPTVDGKRARNVPLQTVNVWSRYNMVQNEYRTLGAALGVLFVDSRLGDFETDLKLPSYTRWDAGLYYTQGRWSTAVYLENLFDTQYVTSSISQFQVFPGAPFNARAMVSVEY